MIGGRRSLGGSQIGSGVRCALAVIAVCASCTPAPLPSTTDSTVEALIEGQAAQATQIQSQNEFLSYLATRIPPAAHAPTTIPSPTPFVSGEVRIEDGRCCIGAVAGTSIEIEADFEATSPMAPVTEMRVRAGARPFEEGEMANAPWEPFRHEAAYLFSVPLNWVGFYVTAQFRDQRQNASAVVYDDISVEGMPPTPLPMTTP